MNVATFPFSKGKGEKNTLELTGNRKRSGKTTNGGSGIKQQDWGCVFPISKSQLSWNPYGAPCLADKHRGKPTRAPFCHKRHELSVIIVGIITVICISHGRVPVLTPEDEHEGSQRKQSVEGRHLFSGGWLPGLNREIPLVNNSPSQILSRKPFGTNCPKGATFWLK